MPLALDVKVTFIFPKSMLHDSGNTFHGLELGSQSYKLVYIKGDQLTTTPKVHFCKNHNLKILPRSLFTNPTMKCFEYAIWAHLHSNGS